MYKDFITGSETNIEQRLWLTIITYVKDYTKIMFIENKPVQCRCRSVSNNYAHLHTSSPKTFTPDGSLLVGDGLGRATPDPWPREPRRLRLRAGPTRSRVPGRRRPGPAGARARPGRDRDNRHRLDSESESRSSRRPGPPAPGPAAWGPGTPSRTSPRRLRVAGGLLCLNAAVCHNSVNL